jgi:hypothetical protein
MGGTVAGKRKPNKNERFVVRNVAGSSRSGTCKCGSWIAHWEKISGRKRPGRCAVDGCGGSVSDGAHVQSLDGRTDKKWWIAPTCTSCNRSRHKEGMGLAVSTILVLARKSGTCGR